MDLLREIGANLSKQRALLAEAKKDLQRIQTVQKSLQETLSQVWNSADLPALEQNSLQWKSFVDLVASGRVLSAAAQANDALKTNSANSKDEAWIGNGKKYAAWLGRGIAHLVKARDETSGVKEWQPVADLCGKSFFLGYTDEIVAAVITSTGLERPRHAEKLQRLVKTLKAHEQRRFLLSTLELISKRYLMAGAVALNATSRASAELVSGAAALLDVVVSSGSESMHQYLSTWALGTHYASQLLARVAIAAMPEEERKKVLEQAWTKFSEKMFVKHASVVQQESLASVVLILAGSVRRSTPMSVFVLAHSSIHTGGVSSRLSSSSPSVRFLGMAVGASISKLVDKPETRMKFEFEGEDRDKFNQLRALLEIDDRVGKLDDLPDPVDQPFSMSPVAKSKRKPQKSLKTSKPTGKIQVVEEDGDDDLTPYAKPDSDAEDSDEDPTLARRKKPKAPVYIRDLITQLSNTEDADIQHLALTTAPSLIRRKADFGSELSDRTIELCSTYFNLSDPFGLDDFLNERLRGMIALLVAQPKICGPYFANIVFEGDFNIGQRVAGLTAMGLAARELAGHKPEHPSEESFPSKTLPERLHKLYLQDTDTEMDRLSKQMSNSMLKPVSTTQKRSQRRIIRNDLSKSVAECFFFPLTGHFGVHGQSIPSARHVLPTFLKTLSIILTSAGPSTLALPQLTTEMFALLLSLRTRVIDDSSCLEALLFGFLSVLNVNEDKRLLAERHAREIVETHEWCNSVFDRLNTGLQGVNEDEERRKTLCAGVLMATKEVIESYERLMVGELVDFSR